MKKKIIIMEDDPFLKEFYSFIFNKIGYDADILEDGDVFFAKLNCAKYNLILMDLSLKNTYFNNNKVDGVTLSRLVKENIIFKTIPIIIVTAHSVDYHSKHLFEESLADAYIIKPISDVHQFINKIDLVMEKYN
ncbi:MAG: response regulator [Bacteroidetes bacterium]|nr:response regulator [Bacteroidota bacterium]MBU1115135.1 response regulator [Bacteroidota bacterium]MBU1799274.1 response regulator [Bacteroidota bacterium]